MFEIIKIVVQPLEHKQYCNDTSTGLVLQTLEMCESIVFLSELVLRQLSFSENWRDLFGTTHSVNWLSGIGHVPVRSENGEIRFMVFYLQTSDNSAAIACSLSA